MNEIPGPFKDKAGHEIVAGDIVIYGAHLGRCAGLRWAKVLEFLPKGEYEDTGDRETKVHVIAVEAEWWGLACPPGRENDFEPPRLQQKRAIIYFGDRILKLHDDQIPDMIRDLLAPYSDEVEP